MKLSNCFKASAQRDEEWYVLSKSVLKLERRDLIQVTIDFHQLDATARKASSLGMIFRDAQTGTPGKKAPMKRPHKLPMIKDVGVSSPMACRLGRWRAKRLNFRA
jgi:hypothetical protein